MQPTVQKDLGLVNGCYAIQRRMAVALMNNNPADVRSQSVSFRTIGFNLPGISSTRTVLKRTSRLGGHWAGGVPALDVFFTREGKYLQGKRLPTWRLGSCRVNRLKGTDCGLDLLGWQNRQNDAIDVGLEERPKHLASDTPTRDISKYRIRVDAKIVQKLLQLTQHRVSSHNDQRFHLRPMPPANSFAFVLRDAYAFPVGKSTRVSQSDDVFEREFCGQGSDKAGRSNYATTVGDKHHQAYRMVPGQDSNQSLSLYNL
jgi:hypothetical protein